MAAYYNEIDGFAAQWLRNLVARGHIASGEVDERSILEVQPDDIKGFKQAHFFAGIGGWSFAARLAGWPDDCPLWTGSCPCQPFSGAGRGKGEADERHLWPAFFSLIKQCQPSAIAGEQVASHLGYRWLAGVRSDLESAGYAVGAVDLCAASVGAPHARQRLWWLAHSDEQFFEPGRPLAGAPRQSEGPEKKRKRLWLDAEHGRGTGGVSDPGSQRLEGSAQNGATAPAVEGGPVYLQCADGKARQIEPGIEPLAYGVPARVGRLRAYGNAIVPQVAAEVLKVFMEARP